LLWSWNRKKNEKNPTIRKFSKKQKKTNVSVRDTDFANSNLANRKNTDFSSRLPDGILGKLNQKGRSPLKRPKWVYVDRSPVKTDQCECVGRSPLKINQDEHLWVGRPWK
jgi:hypothetical protein